MENSYAASMCYEFFIRRAFNCDYNQHESKNEYFKNLIDTERGSNLTSLLGSYDKQLARIKKNIEKAINKFLKSKPTEQEKNGLNQMLEILPHLYHTKEIRELLEKGLEITKRFQKE
jgi:hemerythrin superfamily protein